LISDIGKEYLALVGLLRLMVNQVDQDTRSLWIKDQIWFAGLAVDQISELYGNNYLRSLI